MVGIFCYMQIVYSYFIDDIFFEQQLEGLQYLGASIIMVFAISAAVHKSLRDSGNKKIQEKGIESE